MWYYYAEDIRVPTLWDAATQGGYVVGSVTLAGDRRRHRIPLQHP